MAVFSRRKVQVGRSLLPPLGRLSRLQQIVRKVDLLESRTVNRMVLHACSGSGHGIVLGGLPKDPPACPQCLVWIPSFQTSYWLLPHRPHRPQIGDRTPIAHNRETLTRPALFCSLVVGGAPDPQNKHTDEVLGPRGK